MHTLCEWQCYHVAVEGKIYFIKESTPFNIKDGVGLIVDNVDEHVGLSIIHSALLVHMELEKRLQCG